MSETNEAGQENTGENEQDIGKEYDFLESMLLKYVEIKESGESPEVILGVLTNHIAGHIDLVKDYKLQMIDHLIHCSFLAANNMQDVRIANLEAEVNKLKVGDEFSWGGLILDLLMVIIIEGMIVIAAEAVIPLAAVGVVGVARLHALKKRVRHFKEKIDGLPYDSEDLIKQFTAKYNIKEGSNSLLFNLFKRAGRMPPAEMRILESRIPKEKQLISSMRNLNISKKKLIKNKKDLEEYQTTVNSKVRDLYDRVSKYRIQDAGSGILHSLEGAAKRWLNTSTNEQYAKDKIFTTSHVASYLLEYLTELKNLICYDVAVSNAIINSYVEMDPSDLDSFFLPGKNTILNELNEDYPRVVLELQSQIESTVPITNRIELIYWMMYFRYSGILRVVPVRDQKAREFDGILSNKSILVTREREVNGRMYHLIGGDQFVGIFMIGDEQAHYLISKYIIDNVDFLKRHLEATNYQERSKLIAGLSKDQLEQLAVEHEKPEYYFGGIKYDYEREKNIRLRNLIIILFFIALESRIRDQNIPAIFLDDQLGGSTFGDVFDMIKELEIDVPEVSDEGGGRSSGMAPEIESMFQELKMDNLLLETELLLSKVQQMPFGVEKNETCHRIQANLSHFQQHAQTLTRQQKEKVTYLMQVFEQSPCVRNFSESNTPNLS